MIDRRRARAWFVSSRPAFVGFLLLFGAIGLWSITTPRYAAIDEPAHAVHAAATARGEFLGTPAAQPNNPRLTVAVPSGVAHAGSACFVMDATVSAACMPAWVGEPGLSTVTTYVGRYPPLYYLLVGLPSLAPSGAAMLSWMRLMSAALSAAFLAAAFVSAAQVRNGRLVVVGVAVAISPMAVYLAGVVNPSGLEISAALCLWASGLALFTGADESRRRRLVVWSALSAATFVQIRGLSPLLLAIVGLTLAAVAGWSRVLAVLSRRDARWGLAVVAACGVFAMAWIFGEGSLRVMPSNRPIPPGTSDLAMLRMSLVATGLRMHQMIGVLGWLDTYLPPWSYWVWEAALLVLVAGVVGRNARIAGILAALVLVAIALPTLLAYSQARRLGIIGEGRYIMPVMVGVPVLAAYAWTTHRRTRPRRVPAAVALMGAALALVQVTAFVQALHRYRTGVGAPIWVWHAPWEPPINWLLSIGLFALLQGALLVWWLRLAGMTRPRAARAAQP